MQSIVNKYVYVHLSKLDSKPVFVDKTYIDTRRNYLVSSSTLAMRSSLTMLRAFLRDEEDMSEGTDGSHTHHTYATRITPTRHAQHSHDTHHTHTTRTADQLNSANARIHLRK